jgi:TonB family protein
LQIAALGSLLLHAAVLSLPLGDAQRAGRLARSPQAGTIHALLRPEPAAPDATVPAPATPAPQPRESLPQAARPEPPPRPTPKPEPSGKSAAATESVAIPATYLDPSKLTEPPRPLEEPPVERLLRMMARPGVGSLLLYIDESGIVTNVEIGSSTLPPAVNQRAAELFGAVRFSPGRIDGVAVKTRVRITFGTEERAKQN